MTLAGLVLAVSMATGSSASFALGGRIAVLEVDGVIADDEQFLEDVRRLEDDGSIQGWVLDVNSPGGAVAPSQSMYQRIRQLREADDRPVVASIGSVGASGGYYVALAADSILALPGSITGSIGVIMEYPNVSELMDRVGVSMEVVKSGEQKDMGSPFRDMDAGDREVLLAMVEDVHAQFVEVVARERGFSTEEARALADGRIFSGRQALELGLIDGMGNLEAAIDMAGRMAGLGTDPRVVRPPRPRDGLLSELILGRSAAKAIRRLTDPVAGAVPALKFIVH